MLKQKLIKLNEKQRQAYELMESGKSVFITGSGGVGKSACIKMFYNIHKNIKKIALTSTTGTSAILINGTTLHSYLGIGLGKGSANSIATSISSKKFIKSRWKKLDILIIDEISMLSPELFDKLFFDYERDIEKEEELYTSLNLPSKYSVDKPRILVVISSKLAP